MPDQQHLVVIVDDDEAIRDALRFSLQLMGLDVHTHHGSAELLMDPDLPSASCVILGDQTPQIDGFELLRDLCARNVRVPVILLTYPVTAPLRARAIAAGVRLVLEKPVLDNALVNEILTVLNKTA